MCNCYHWRCAHSNPNCFNFLAFIVLTQLRQAACCSINSSNSPCSTAVDICSSVPTSSDSLAISTAFLPFVRVAYCHKEWWVGRCYPFWYSTNDGRLLRWTGVKLPSPLATYWVLVGWYALSCANCICSASLANSLCRRLRCGLRWIGCS